MSWQTWFPTYNKWNACISLDLVAFLRFDPQFKYLYDNPYILFYANIYIIQFLNIVLHWILYSSHFVLYILFCVSIFMNFILFISAGGRWYLPKVFWFFCPSFDILTLLFFLWIKEGGGAVSQILLVTFHLYMHNYA